MRILPILAALGCFALSAAPAAAQSETTRIETRPFYGAVVTIEEGVRVFRPLPTTKRVIINPGGVTPLSLGFNETTVNERRYNYNYNYGSDERPSRGSSVGGYYGYGGYGLGRGHGGRHHGGGHRGGGHRGGGLGR
ncbi:MAG: hypothetical protein KDJ37_03585 [Hyphomicrobiaceae bacterium]|nr:hypothetical protein [Hyphomicrobiaceae bacterium]